MSFTSREALERQRAQEAYNNFVGERTRGNAVEQERVKDAADARRMVDLVEKGLDLAIGGAEPDFFPEFDRRVAAEIVVAYILGGR
jgi:hypothetical protein